MGVTQEMNIPVFMDQNGIYINGKSEIVLCSSLFYFRIPRGLWKDRLKKVKDAGYNCIDVYFPWNYHETAPGEWDFTDEKNVEYFLQLAKEEDLWVVARPGPYICSEWDGGGLPAYLFTDQSMKVRDNDPKYLNYVSKWFDKILPILKKYELGNEGTIITIQLENELDFYGCDDRHGYITALREMAEKHHISVPLFACAGQGDIYGATGFAKNVMPACNFYPHDKDPYLEARVFQYYEKLQSANYPLCVSETNRPHYLLRRLLSVGAKLLGPYNQVSGTDFGFTNGINNWGNPLALLTSDYDFGGMVSPEGIIRPEHREGQLLSQFMNALGPSLAEATPHVERELSVQSHMTRNDHGPYALALKDGGKALFLPNLDDVDHHAQISNGTDTFPTVTDFKVPADRCQIVLYDVPLNTWNLTGRLKYTTAELGFVHQDQLQTMMVFHTENEAEINLELPKDVKVHAKGIKNIYHDKSWTFSFSAQQSLESDDYLYVTIEYQDETILTIVGMDRIQAAKVKGVSETGELVLQEEIDKKKQQIETRQTNWTYHKINENKWLESAEEVGEPLALEMKGYYRGYGWYKSQYRNDQISPIQGVLLHKASDIISFYCNSIYYGTSTPGGGFQYYPLENTTDNLELMIRSEIWGHSNFNSPLLPSLVLNSLKGMQGLTVVHKSEVLTNEWNYLSVDQELSEVPMIDYNDPLWKPTTYDGFLTNTQPKRGYYHKLLNLDQDYDHHILSFKGINCLGKIYIDGVFIDYINPLNPYIDISTFTLDQSTNHLIVYLEQYYDESGGTVSLLSGNKSEQWKMYGLDEKGLAEKSEQEYIHSHQLDDFPFVIPSGEIGWLNTSLRYNHATNNCLIADVTGENVKFTVLFNQTIVGRVWLPSKTRPIFTGGGQNRFYLPSSLWETEHNNLNILVEAIESNEQATIDSIQFTKIQE